MNDAAGTVLSMGNKDKNGHRLFAPRLRGGRPWNGRVVVVELGRNPSTDFYLRPRLEASEAHEVIYCALESDRPSPSLLTDGTVVIVCRYVNATWLETLRQARERLASLVYFMDDDLPAVAGDPTLPLAFRHRVARYFDRMKGRLADLCDGVWVSTPELARRYPEAGAAVVPPIPIAMDRDVPPPAGGTVFYHATLTRAPEVRWLLPVVDRLCRCRPRVTFELIAGALVGLPFRWRPGVQVRTYMPWTAYQAELTGSGRAVGLAPLGSSPFNDARATTKYFDITRAGAVGIYADRGACAEFVRHGEDGLLVGNDVDAWAEAIAELVRDPERLRSMAANARARCAEVTRTRLEETSLAALMCSAVAS